MKAPNKARKAQSNDWAFLLYGILAVDCLESSTVKTGIREANNLAALRLNALSSAKGIKAPNKSTSPLIERAFCILSRKNLFVEARHS
ncbi:hypothetical protein A5320_06060 [Rheinheimera sp. SA_1]|nr:hypothetical protein A5320_06060 [Rheinheimera sp. SA_1]